VALQRYYGGPGRINRRLGPRVFKDYSDGDKSYVENGEKIRFIVLDDVKGKTVTIVVETIPQAFEEFMPKAQKVVDCVKWGGS
jgi:hypothetical protein